MKYIRILILLFSIQSFSQNDYISKAERIINSNEKPNIEKVTKLLTKAKKADYGFCGNAWHTAFDQIHYLEGRLYFKHNQYRESLVALDSTSYNWQADSLKVKCLIALNGREKVFQLVREASDGKTVTRDGYSYTLPICLNLGLINYNFCLYDQNDNYDYKKEISVWEIIENSNFYSLLKG